MEEDTDEPQRTRSPTIPTRAGELELERHWHVLSRVVSLPQPQGRLATKLNLLEQELTKRLRPLIICCRDLLVLKTAVAPAIETVVMHGIKRLSFGGQVGTGEYILA